MWQILAGGVKEYRHGREDWAGAAHEAAVCVAFRSDVEEETVCDDERSCYNCRYRRWTATSFTCLAPCSTVAQV